MTYRRRRRGALWLMLLLLAAAVALLEKATYDRIQKEGSYIENLSFVTGNSASKQIIRCFADETENTIYLFLPSYEELDEVTVSFDGADRLVFSGEGQEVSLKNGGHIGTLTCGTAYRLSFLDRRGRKLDEEKLMIMRSANLPALFLETESGSMEMLDADKNYAERGKIVLFDACGNMVCADDLSRISGRGNSTWAHPKKSYGIRLKNRTDLFGMGSADNWILLSNVEDPAYIRNKITYDMAIAAGMEGSPESQYIDLYINHMYHGMYQLCEKVEIDKERVDIADLEEENKRHNDMQKCGHFEEEKRKGTVLFREPDDLTGGYLLERDVPDKYREEISGFITDTLGDLYTIKEPAYASEAEVNYISGLVNAMEKALVSEDGVNPDTGMSYTDYIDMRSFAQKYVLEELSKNNGAGATSSFFYKPEDEISTMLFAGPVWDYDKAFASISGLNESTQDLCYLTLRDSNPTTLFWRLYQQPEFREAVSVCYEEFFSDYMQKIADEKIDEYASQIRTSVAMDRIRWGEADDDLLRFEDQIARLRAFVEMRREFLDAVWIEGEELCTVTFISETGEAHYVSVSAGSSLEKLPGSEPGTVSGDRMFDGWYTQEGKMLTIGMPITQDITVYSKSHEL